MSNIQYRLLGGEQVIPLLGDEQTTRSRVVMIVLENSKLGLGEFGVLTKEMPSSQRGEG